MAKASHLLTAIERDKRDVFVVAQDYADGEEVPAHAHPVCQLLHAISGVMLARIDERLWTIPPGRALWIPPNVEHAFTMRGLVRVRAVFIQPKRAAAVDAHVVSLQVSPLAEQLIQRLDDTDSRKGATDLRRLIVPLLLEELRSSPRAAQGVRIPHSRVARRVADSIVSNPEDRTEFASIARRSGTSAKTLARRFVDETGVTPDAWRRLARLSEAAARLEAGQSVSKVAFDLGYETVSGFCQAYRKCHGQTPGSIRRHTRRK